MSFTYPPMRGIVSILRTPELRSFQYRTASSESLRPLARCPAQSHVVKTDVAIGHAGPPMTKQVSGDVQALAVHDCERGVHGPQVMQPRARHDPGRVARPSPEPVEVALAQRSVRTLAGEHPFPGRRSGEAVQQFLRRLAEQNVRRFDLRVNRGQAVGPARRRLRDAQKPGPAQSRLRKRRLCRVRHASWQCAHSRALRCTNLGEFPLRSVLRSAC